MSSLPTSSTREHLAVLDGWRGISILFVLAAHLLPLGPKAWTLNAMAGPMGMALFFTLSGFLITRFLLHNDRVSDFLIRRLFRIVPLAWLAMAITLPLVAAPAAYYLPHFLFYANWPPTYLTHAASHLWSLCVEVQFYVGIALVVALFGRRGLLVLPVLCIAVTLHRVATHTYVDIATWLRVDEILAGGMLALAHGGKFGGAPSRWLPRLNPYLMLGLLALSSHPVGGFLNYLRPYIAALLVGSTLFAARPRLDAVLQSRVLKYIAEVSYALYVIHHLLMFTWLGTGERLEKYLKRPLLFAATFALAHVSTFHFEHRCIAFGKRLSARLAARGVVRAQG
jgi:peptidoglycan/LPS O-acetylase OafA/YrhL